MRSVFLSPHCHTDHTLLNNCYPAQETKDSRRAIGEGQRTIEKKQKRA